MCFARPLTTTLSLLSPSPPPTKINLIQLDDATVHHPSCYLFVTIFLSTDLTETFTKRSNATCFTCPYRNAITKTYGGRFVILRRIRQVYLYLKTISRDRVANRDQSRDTIVDVCIVYIVRMLAGHENLVYLFTINSFQGVSAITYTNDRNVVAAFSLPVVIVVR